MSKFRFDVVSLFPEAFKNFFNHGLIKKAFQEKIAYKRYCDVKDILAKRTRF